MGHSKCQQENSRTVRETGRWSLHPGRAVGKLKQGFNQHCPPVLFRQLLVLLPLFEAESSLSRELSSRSRLGAATVPQQRADRARRGTLGLPARPGYVARSPDAIFLTVCCETANSVLNRINCFCKDDMNFRAAESCCSRWKALNWCFINIIWVGFFSPFLSRKCLQ